MDFFGIGAWEILLIGLIALSIFGPKQLILFARKAGEYTRKFQLMWQENMKVLEDEMRAIENEVADVKTELQTIGTDLQKETAQIGSQIQENTNQINATLAENAKVSDAATAPETNQIAPPELAATPTEPATTPVNDDTVEPSAAPVSYPAWTESSKN